MNKQGDDKKKVATMWVW